MSAPTESTSPHSDIADCLAGIREIAKLMISSSDDGDIAAGIYQLAERGLERLSEIAPSA